MVLYLGGGRVSLAGVDETVNGQEKGPDSGNYH